MGAAVAGLAAALVLTGCSSDGGGDGGGGGKKDGGAAEASDSGGSGGSADSGSADEGSSGGSGGSGGSLEGTWIATAGGKPLALAVTGKSATLLGEDVLCNGTAGEKAGSRMINLKCPTGNSDRTTGRIESVDGKSMKVSWEGAGQDEFLKTKGGKLPAGLPSGDMPQP
ncbi:hypothetical protein AB0C93_30375 [Streptomyces sp. NPDC048518]|uniref:hypothetical protein n=1 Tax=Streptomyces sp. NPDC048518 TaxID=3155029 RepID=UPI0033ECE3B9